MAFKSSKFTVASYATSGISTNKDYADFILNSFATAFIASNSTWEQVGYIETIGTYTGSDRGLRTIQLKSTLSNEYVRLWYFCGSNIVMTIPTTETASGSYNAIKLYKGNTQRISESSSHNDDLYGPTSNELFIAVSDSSINVDFGYNLTLKCPIFGIDNSKSYSSSFAPGSQGNSTTYNYGGTYSIISDGKMFGIMVLTPDNHYPMVFYAPDMIICADPSDTYTAGILSSRGTAFSSDFNLGTSSTSTFTTCTCLFSSASGSFDFSYLIDELYNSKPQLWSTQSSTKMPTGPVAVYLYPQTYNGSTSTAVKDGVCMKGWINTDYIRSVNNTILPAASRGLTYSNGRWLCTGVGTLVCWDSTNPTPFEA